jgi:hypothetical protein
LFAAILNLEVFDLSFIDSVGKLEVSMLGFAFFEAREPQVPKAQYQSRGVI